MKKERDLVEQVFIAYTPYHVLLSCALAAGIGSPRGTEIIIFHDFADIEKIADVVRHGSILAPTSVKVQKGAYQAKKYNQGYASILKRDSSINIQKQNVSFIRDYFKRNQSISTVYTFHDGRAESQISEYINKKRGGTNIYVEDGMAVYMDYTFPAPTFSRRLHYKLYYSPWHQFIRYHGGYKYTDKIMCLNPSLVREELKSKPVQKIPREALLRLNEKGLIDALVEQYGFSSHERIDAVVILAHSEFVRQIKAYDRYRDVVQQVLTIAKSAGINIFIKYHPREKDFYLQSTEGYVSVIPQGLPVEALFLHLSDAPPRIMLGDITTALLTGKLICNGSKVVSFLDLLIGNEYHNVRNVFGKAGVELPKDICQLEALLTGG